MSSPSIPLIVDFPSHPRSKSYADDCKPSARPRSVRFSTTEITFFGVTGDKSSKFYSSEEKRHFKTEVARDARQIVAFLNTGRSPEAPSQELLCKFIGIEKMVHPHKARASVAHRRAHADAIISRQDTCTAEELGRLSRASSRSDCNIAQSWLLVTLR